MSDSTRRPVQPDLRGGAVLGRFCHAPTPDAAPVLHGLLVEIDASGIISGLHPEGAPGHAAAMARAEAAGRLFRPHGLVLPGLVDLHVHAPQYRQLGQALDRPLEEWLLAYTFPLEARFADAAFAAATYTALVGDLLACGTTTAVYFGTIHDAATALLAETCVRHGQRALVGRVAMDHPELCPSNYRDADAQAALAGTRAVIEAIGAIPGNDGLVCPAITPRFIPACTDALLEGLGRLAAETGCAVQTHCSESDWAHAHVRARCGCSDAAALDRFGLLGRRSVLAHANFLSADDMALVAARGAGVAHCPLSNAYFAGAVFPLRAALSRGVRVGLGSDISGGPCAPLFEAARMAVAASRMLETGVDPERPAAGRGRPGSASDIAQAVHLATAGGADVLDLKVGRFAPGYAFDAMLVDPGAEEGGIRLWGGESDADMLATVLYGATRANIAGVWTAGRAADGGGRRDRFAPGVGSRFSRSDIS